MKVTFLGSGHGVPSAERYCSCIMIESGEDIYFLDAGAPIMEELLRLGKDINKVRSVFITHCHTDHTLGMIGMISLANWYYKNSAMDVYVPEQPLIDVIKEFFKCNHNYPVNEDRLRFHAYESDFSYEDENISLSVIPTRHLEAKNAPSYAFVVTCKHTGKSLLLTGDLSQKLALDDFPAIAAEKEIDAVVSEMAHFGTNEIKPYLEKCRAKAVYFNHVFPLAKFDDIEAANGAYPFPLYVVKDRDVIEL